MSEYNNFNQQTEKTDKNGGNVLKPWRRTIILVVGIILVLAALFSTEFNKKIQNIGGVNLNNITSIGFQYDNPAKLPGGVTVKDPAKVNEFLKLINGCVVRRKIFQPEVSGYYLLAAFNSNGKRVLDIMFMGDYIIIDTPDGKQTQYNIVKGSISDEQLDRYIQSIKQ